MTAKQIACRLSWQHFDRQRQVVVPNLTKYVIGEADLVGLYPSGWMDEVEIKISKSDFRREFQTKAEKHDWLVRGVPEYRSRWEFSRVDGYFNETDVFDPCNPLHEPVVGWKNEITGFRDWTEPGQHRIRRFWFAMPLDLAREIEHEVPSHAGLIGVDERCRRVLRQAPILKHSKKVTDTERADILRLAYLRFWDLQLKLCGESKEIVDQSNALMGVQG